MIELDAPDSYINLPTRQSLDILIVCPLVPREGNNLPGFHGFRCNHLVLDVCREGGLGPMNRLAYQGRDEDTSFRPLGHQAVSSQRAWVLDTRHLR